MTRSARKNLSTPESAGTLRVALAQMNATVGDLSGNGAKMANSLHEAKRHGADLVVFPELAVTGYPPEDLLHKPSFVRDASRVVDSLLPHSRGLAAVVGVPVRGAGGELFNSAAVIADGRLVGIYHKIHLPNYGVFDEARYFTPGASCQLFELRGVRFGVSICEDVWASDGPARIQAEGGAELLVNINASPFWMDKLGQRQAIVTGLARSTRSTVIYLNLVGGQDELVFDGGSFVVDHDGRTILSAPQFRDGLYFADLNMTKQRAARGRLDGPDARECWLEPETIVLPKRKAERRPVPAALRTPMRPDEEAYEALLLGTRDYVQKNGFSGVLIALSGGVDSALVASIAVDALGPGKTTGVFLPSPYTSKESREDAFALADNLGIRIHDIPIDGLFDSFRAALAPVFKGLKPDITEENLQARIRGTLVMALSNKFGWLVLTTGNKSEMSVGYATLYGDMAGGFAVIKDVPKTLVYRLCRWRNRKSGGPWIPKRILTKAPTAELRPGQKDTDSLPPYAILDPILKAYVEEEKSVEEIVVPGCASECVIRVARMVDRAEYKRRQAPPGVKITSRAFGRDRRYPITNRYTGGMG